MIHDAQARELYHRATMLADAARPQEALMVLRGVLASEPQSVQAHCLAARCLLMLGQPARACVEAHIAIGCDPTAEWPQRLRSMALDQTDNRPAALEAAREAVRLAPQEYRGHIQLAELLARDGQKGAALDAARRAVEVSPGTAAPYITLSLVASIARDWPECERAATLALQMQPDSAAAMNNLGVALTHRRRHLLALSLFSRSAGSDPTRPLLRGNINAVFLTIAGFTTSLALSTIVLVALLILGDTHRAATPVAAILATVAAGALVTIVSRGRAWYQRLPRSAKNAVRDRRSWAATLNKPEVTTSGLISTLFFAQLWYGLITASGLLIAVAGLNALGDSNSPQTPEATMTLLWIGSLGIAYFSVLRWFARRAKERARHSVAPAPPRVEVDWP